MITIVLNVHLPQNAQQNEFCEFADNLTASAMQWRGGRRSQEQLAIKWRHNATLNALIIIGVYIYFTHYWVYVAEWCGWRSVADCLSIRTINAMHALHTHVNKHIHLPLPSASMNRLTILNVYNQICTVLIAFGWIVAIVVLACGITTIAIALVVAVMLGLMLLALRPCCTQNQDRNVIV